jgi:hypothetical protein
MKTFGGALHIAQLHAVAKWLKLYDTNWKVPGSRPDEVNGIFQFTYSLYPH